MIKSKDNEIIVNNISICDSINENKIIKQKYEDIILSKNELIYNLENNLKIHFSHVSTLECDLNFEKNKIDEKNNKLIELNQYLDEITYKYDDLYSFLEYEFKIDKTINNNTPFKEQLEKTINYKKNEM